MKNEWQKEIFKNHEYWGKVIAIVDGKIIDSANSYTEIDDKMKEKNLKFCTFKFPRQYDAYRILTFKIKSISRHDWKPFYPINFTLKNGLVKEESILIDSSADISIINYQFGEYLGFQTDEHEISNYAEGVGSRIRYLMRENEIEIDGIKFKNHFAWIQDKSIDDMIIGRDIVFDMFDVEFKQAEETIIFKKR